MPAPSRRDPKDEHHPGLLSDPWVEAQIDEAIAPYAGVLSADQLSWMREQLAETLTTDEDAARLLRRDRKSVV